jgi:predicted MFS family arabinose efflux permease
MSRLLPLAAGTFAVGTETFVIAGILPEIGAALGVSVAAAGTLVTAFALTYAISSPVLATLLGNVPRRTLLLGALGGFVCANLLAASADSFVLLMAARIAMGLCAGLITPTANAIAVALSAPERRGRALALVSGGLTLAMTVGVPLGTAVAVLGTWRYSFLLVAALGAAAFVGVFAGLRQPIPLAVTTFRQRLAVARRPGVARALAMTLVWSLGVFTFYTYLAVFLARYAGISGYGLSAAFVFFGAMGALGNSMGGRLSDQLGPLATLRVALGALALSLLGLGLAAAWLPAAAAFALIVPLIGLWAVAGWCVNAPQASRLAALAGEAPSVALSLNAAALYVGTAAGAVLGSVALRSGEVWHLGLLAAACEGLALLVLGFSSPLARAASTPAGSGLAGNSERDAAARPLAPDLAGAKVRDA